MHVRVVPCVLCEPCVRETLGCKSGSGADPRLLCLCVKSGASRDTFDTVDTVKLLSLFDVGTRSHSGSRFTS